MFTESSKGMEDRGPLREIRTVFFLGDLNSYPFPAKDSLVKSTLFTSTLQN